MSEVTTKGRYSEVPTHQVKVGDREVTYNRLRLLPTVRTVTLHPVSQGERVDQIAQQHLQDAEQYWRICDANGAMLPSDLESEIGRPLRIPLPWR